VAAGRQPRPRWAGAELAATWAAPLRPCPRHMWTELLRAAGPATSTCWPSPGCSSPRSTRAGSPPLAEKGGQRHPGYGCCWGDPAGEQLAARRPGALELAAVSPGAWAAVLGYYRQMPEAVELRLHDTPAVQLGPTASMTRCWSTVHALRHPRRLHPGHATCAGWTARSFNTYIESFGAGLGNGEGTPRATGRWMP